MRAHGGQRFLSGRKVFELSELALGVMTHEATTHFFFLRPAALVPCAAFVMTGHFAIFQSILKKVHFRLDQRQP